MKSSKTRVEEFIRVDHAGERGAVKIYEGQLLALNTIVKDDDLKKTIEEMKIHEKEHCEFFETEIKKSEAELIKDEIAVLTAKAKKNYDVEISKKIKKLKRKLRRLESN